jgi:hypothetical protein
MWVDWNLHQSNQQSDGTLSSLLLIRRTGHLPGKAFHVACGSFVNLEILRHAQSTNIFIPLTEHWRSSMLGVHLVVPVHHNRRHITAGRRRNRGKNQGNAILTGCNHYDSCLCNDLADIMYCYRSFDAMVTEWWEYQEVPENPSHSCWILGFSMAAHAQRRWSRWSLIRRFIRPDDRL